MKRDEEVDRFKTQINLVEYAEAQGYQIDPRESSKASTVMRAGDDKIIVATAQDGHGIYFSVRDDSDNGSIIDFVQKRQGLNLGKVRQELRPWCDGPIPSSYRPKQDRRPEAERPRKPLPLTRDQQQVLAAWIKMAMIEHGQHPYLVKQRRLDPKVIADPRFAGMVKMDSRGNAVFPHYDKSGLTGYELKNHQFTGFAKHGEKALWFSSNIENAPRLVVVESAIDAISHAQLTRNKDAAYVSLGGQPSPKQLQLFREVAAEAAARGAVIVLATDGDPAGDKLAAMLKALMPPGAQSEREIPSTGKDWNEQLQAQPRKAQTTNLGLTM